MLIRLEVLALLLCVVKYSILERSGKFSTCILCVVLDYGKNRHLPDM